MQSEKKFENLMDESKRITLSKEEKEIIRSRLISFIKNDFATSKQQSAQQGFYRNMRWLYINPLNAIKSVNARALMRYGFLSLFVMLFLGFGIATGAQNSLPGD